MNVLLALALVIVTVVALLMSELSLPSIAICGVASLPKDPAVSVAPSLNTVNVINGKTLALRPKSMISLVNATVVMLEIN